MKTILVRYTTVDAAAAETNAALVRAVFEELRGRAPDGFRYACHRLADGCTFVHVATLADGATSPLRELASFKAFQAGLGARTLEPPAVSEGTVVGAYA